MKEIKKEKAIFIDRDGVINIENDYVYKISDFIFIEGVFEAIKHFRKLGYLIFIITNQSGIGRGYYSSNDFNKLNNWMLEQFKEKEAHIDAVYHCPHKPDEQCYCRKPNPGMVYEAARSYNVDLKRSWIIGDRERDLQAGYQAGITGLILIRSLLNQNEANSIASYTVESLIDSVKIIKENIG